MSLSRSTTHISWTCVSSPPGLLLVPDSSSIPPSLFFLLDKREPQQWIRQIQEDRRSCTNTNFGSHSHCLPRGIFIVLAFWDSDWIWFHMTWAAVLPLLWQIQTNTLWLPGLCSVVVLVLQGCKCEAPVVQSKLVHLINHFKCEILSIN